MKPSLFSHNFLSGTAKKTVLFCSSNFVRGDFYPIYLRLGPFPRLENRRSKNSTQECLLCVKKSFLMVLKLPKEKKEKQKFRFGGFHFFHRVVVANGRRKKAIGKNNQSITVRVYKRRKRLLNKTEFFIVVEQKERLAPVRRLSLSHPDTWLLFHSKASRLLLLYTF